jgi:hypothetical protein
MHTKTYTLQSIPVAQTIAWQEKLQSSLELRVVLEPWYVETLFTEHIAFHNNLVS